MEKFLNLVRSNNMVQAVLCIAFGLFLMIYPSITVQGIILLFGVALAVMGAAGLVSYFRQRSVRYRDSGTLMSAVFYVIIALIAFIFPESDRRVLFGGARRGASFARYRERGARLRAARFRQQHLDCRAGDGGAGGYRRRAHRGEPVGRLHDLRARAGRDVHRQRRGRSVHRVVHPRF